MKNKIESKKKYFPTNIDNNIREASFEHSIKSKKDEHSEFSNISNKTTKSSFYLIPPEVLRKIPLNVNDSTQANYKLTNNTIKLNLEELIKENEYEECGKKLNN